ncbi:hypothetical protein AVEN_209088-1 [Araneus ventricosus]|uniref:Uncharacterized protein n=1 Tax=Araneus ventricosus TaxID=182803 RepID=A0A4Y2IHA1_ARAVE|nr:hypothetical protein AVEN_209088-1 [Araneus ventricosus]
MMNGLETDLEVGGSIGISNTEETVTESSEGSIAKEESALEKTSRRRAVKKTVVWKTFKSIVFLICLIFLIIHSVDFFSIYYKYPTIIVLETTVAKEFKLPAITFCFRNTISFKEFCSYEPDWCETPGNMEEFCKKQRSDCRNGTANLTIPMQNKMTRRVMQRYLFNDSYNDALLFRYYNYSSKARTFTEDSKDDALFLKCYSENLHLYRSRSKLKTQKLNEPDVFVGIHSPYVPIDIDDLHAIRPGEEYEIDVQLEKEEHLLPPPYQTDCSYNGPSKDDNESTNPNSYEMCLELCKSEYTKAYFGCDWGMTMIPSLRDLCIFGNFERPNISPEQKVELQDKRLVCFQNCKQGCLKLQYKCRIKETQHFMLRTLLESKIIVYMKNPEVTVLRHVPFYGSGELFSHVGGILCCWLGISVFTFTDIMENGFRKVVRWKMFKKRKEKRAPTSEIHQE